MHPASTEASLLAKEAGIPLSVAGCQGRLIENTLLLAMRLIWRKGCMLFLSFWGNRAPFGRPQCPGDYGGFSVWINRLIALSRFMSRVSVVCVWIETNYRSSGRAGLNIARVVISGGAGQDPLVRQLIADATGKGVVAPSADEPVILGTAMLAAVAAGAYSERGGCYESDVVFRRSIFAGC